MQVSNVSAGQQYTVKMQRKALDIMEQAGEAAVSLIEKAGEAGPRPEGTKGHIVSTVA